MIVESDVGVDVLAGNGKRPEFLHVEDLVGQLRDLGLGLRPCFHYPVRQVTNEVEEKVTLRHTDHYKHVQCMLGP